MIMHYNWVSIKLQNGFYNSINFFIETLLQFHMYGKNKLKNNVIIVLFYLIFSYAT